MVNTIQSSLGSQRSPTVLYFKWKQVETNVETEAETEAEKVETGVETETETRKQILKTQSHLSGHKDDGLCN
jgi:hypothetical protein